QARARLNIRFNPAHKGQELADWIASECRRAEEGFSGRVMLEAQISGEAFLTRPDAFVDVVASAVRETTGREPELSTSGGTSDARFIRSLCPVVEFGLVGATMHAVDERAPTAEIQQLAAIYRRLIEGYFARFG